MKSVYIVVFSGILTIGVLFPYAIQAVHALSYHNHHTCVEYSKTHFHKQDIDCDILNYKLPPQISLSVEHFTALKFHVPKHNLQDYYTFLSRFKVLPFSLRGPPSIS
ncbi:hypothetical protein [Leptobacterium sp. I13]|uniref:hypothetical protein n=1 Tax=Leptobacterium meishanense TaxID=3128904 RepID=UPI0030EBA24B